MNKGRPKIYEIQTGTELKKWYWLKDELVAFAKVNGVSYAGSKFEILDRIANRLDGQSEAKPVQVKIKSKFNWAKEILTPDTLITDSYTNGPNTREFFKQHCGARFSFSIPFMAWMKVNQGKKLSDAIEFWKSLNDKSKKRSHPSEIPSGNQYNQYVRDFFADNPGKTLKEAQLCWKLKRSLPLGKHVYERTDLQLVERTRR
jgi:hypothetical protein